MGLKYNTLDSVGPGREGSYWCLQSVQGFYATYTKGCFYTPSYKSEERGLLGIYNLGQFLWSFSGLDKKNELY